MNPEIQQQANHEVLVVLLSKIIELLDTEKEPAPTLQADEVRAALRNELSAVIKSIKAIPDDKDILKQLKSLQDAISKIEFSPTINVAAAEVTIPEIKVPDITVPNIQVPTINVPTPQVNYTAPDIHIPAPVVNLPPPVVNIAETDFSELIRAIEVNLNRIRTNSETRPLAVRLSDGQGWLKELRTLFDKTQQAIVSSPGPLVIKNASGGIINPATEEGQNTNKLVPYVYDYVELTPAALPTSIVYKIGGASGTTVCTLTLVYSGNDLSSITRTP